MDHEHHFQFLRQEIRPIKHRQERVLERVIEDVFGCEGCLEYRVIKVRTEEPARDRFGWVEVK